MTTPDWPTALLSPVARARALAASLPGAGYAETTIDAPFEATWALIADLERSVPASDKAVRSLRIRSRRPIADEPAPTPGVAAERLRVTSWGNPPLPFVFDVRLEPGYCLMRATGRVFVVVMAAEPHPDDATKTRYGHVEVIARSWGRPFRRLMARMVAGDVEGFRRYVESHTH